MKHVTLTLFAASGLLLTSSCGPGGSSSSQQQGGEPALKFSAIPDQNTTELKEKFDGLARYLEGALGVPVEFVPSTDYAASVEMFKNGDIQLAWFGGLTGVQARAAVEGAHAIAQGKEDPDYFSYFIAHKDTGLARTDDFPTAIKDLKFTFGPESSTSGRLMPTYFIRQNTGQDPEEFFTHPLNFSGSHDKTAELVQSSQWEAGALSYTAYDKLVEEGAIDAEVCKVIWKTPVYADYNFTAHPMLEEMFGEGFTGRLQQALIGLDDPEVLKAFPREALIGAKDEDFAGTGEVARQLGFL